MDLLFERCFSFRWDGKYPEAEEDLEALLSLPDGVSSKLILGWGVDNDLRGSADSVTKGNVHTTQTSSKKVTAVQKRTALLQKGSDDRCPHFPWKGTLSKV